MMESWMVSLGIGIITYISVIVTMRNKIDNHSKILDDREDTFKRIFTRLDQHGDDLVKLNTKAELSMTSKDVDDKYVSKELFRQFEKHIDKRFDRIEEGQGKILSFIEKSVNKEK